MAISTKKAQTIFCNTLTQLMNDHDDGKITKEEYEAKQRQAYDEFTEIRIANEAKYQAKKNKVK